MIYTVITGRCGNQLFTYCFIKKVQKMYNREQVTLCDGILFGQSKKDQSFRVVLEDFVSESFELWHNECDPIDIYGSSIQKIVYRIFVGLRSKYVNDRNKRQRFEEKYQWIINKFGIYYMSQSFAKLAKTKEKNKFIYGNYENLNWLKDDREEILSLIKPRHGAAVSTEFYKKIVESESVCVAIRRGDFLDAENRSLRAICNENYFRRAIRKMKEIKPNAVFFFFSDEIEWVKENYDFGVECFYESGCDSESTTIFLMSKCKNFIISNSTFNWWAQYLSVEEDKIVISPDHWFNVSGYEHPLIDDNWVLIDCSN